MSLTERKVGLKTAWRNLSTRARLGEVFGFIDALALAYKTGHLKRDAVLELLNSYVKPAELAEYRRVRGHDGLTTATRAFDEPLHSGGSLR